MSLMHDPSQPKQRFRARGVPVDIDLASFQQGRNLTMPLLHRMSGQRCTIGNRCFSDATIVDVFPKIRVQACFMKSSQSPSCRVCVRVKSILIIAETLKAGGAMEETLETGYRRKIDRPRLPQQSEREKTAIPTTILL
jgi:hypothetical protein